MMQRMLRSYLLLESVDYIDAERDLQLYIGPLLINRNLRPSQISFLEWDLYVVDTIDPWQVTQLTILAQKLPERAILIWTQRMWEVLPHRTENMLFCDDPIWVTRVLNCFEDWNNEQDPHPRRC